jgi:hypothetical protein
MEDAVGREAHHAANEHGSEQEGDRLLSGSLHALT